MQKSTIKCVMLNLSEKECRLHTDLINFADEYTNIYDYKVWSEEDFVFTPEQLDRFLSVMNAIVNAPVVYPGCPGELKKFVLDLNKMFNRNVNSSLSEFALTVNPAVMLKA
jgi:hypothetical protein